MSDRLSREALIEAAARAQYEHEVETHQIFYHGPWEQLAGERDWFITDAARAVDAIVPLIADAIETKRDEHFAEYGNEETGPRNYDWALTHAADLVRSLGGGQ